MKTKTILSIAIMAALPFGAHADPVGPAAVPANGTAVVATANAPYVTQTPTAADATHIASTAYVKGAYNDAIAAVNKLNDSKQNNLGLTETMDAYELMMNSLDFALGGDHNAVANTSDKAVTAEGVITTIGEYHAAFTQQLDGALSGKQDDLGLTEMMNASVLRDRAMRYTVDHDNTAIANTSDKGVSAEGVIETLYEYDKYLQQGVLPDKQDKLTTTVNNASQNISSTVAQTVNTTTPSATTLVSEAAIANAMNNYATTTALNNKRVEIYTTWDNDNAKTEVAFVNATPAQSGQ